MPKKNNWIPILLGGVSALALAAPAYAQEGADAGAADTDTRRLPSVLVQSQRVEQNIQDVPIAVTAYDEEALDLLQIDSVQDIQISTPNVYFTKTFFSGSNLQIRGVGTLLTAASADTGVGIHINDVYLNEPRLFETEYYDVERIEILRGPQGTLYGRNSTGGTMNLITNKPVLEEVQADASIQVGNFDHLRVKGMVNLPVGDNAAFRLAGIALSRDGYTETVDPRATFDSLDGREQWSARASFGWEPTPRTRIDLVASYFEEDDNRVRIPKTLCDFDPTAVLGCLPTGNGNGAANFSATFGGIFLSDIVLGGLGLFPFGTIESNPNPPGLRQVFVDEEPEYFADETFFMGAIEHEFSDTLTLNANMAYQETSVFSRQFGSSPIGAGNVTIPAAVAFLLPTNFATYFADGNIPTSGPDANDTGAVGGNIFRSAAGVFSFDQSEAEAEQFSSEIRLNSSFDGALNFMLAANYHDFERTADYYVFSNSLDYFSLVSAAVTGAPDGTGLLSPYFRNQTDPYALESYAIFGETYFEPNEDWKFTAGLRWTHDEKSIRDRSLPLLNTANALAVPSSIVPIGDAADAAADAFYSTTFDADPSLPGNQAFREASVTFEEVTGRLVADWTPNLSFTNDTLIYASYSRGYKGGGLNPALNPAVAAQFNIPATFEPEFINAYEIGSKNTFADGRVQANVAAFYYDYDGLQIGRGVAQTVINENVDAEILGAEGEFLFAPTDALLFNLNVAVLDTEIKDFAVVDSRDLTAGESGHILIKDLSNAEHCVLYNADPTVFSTLTSTPTIPVPGLESPAAFSGCAALAGVFGSVPESINPSDPDYRTVTGIGPGVERDISGNSLPYSPEMKITLGGQYTHDMDSGASVVFRTDYTWQDETWAGIFNDPRRDQIDAWEVWNAQLTYFAPDDRWFFRAFVQNILDDDNITFHSTGAASTGLATNVALQDPQLYGFELGVRY